jgi:hypothetical protein
MSLVDAAARELPQIALDDALRILLVMAAKHDERYDRAAARFAARVTLERRLGLEESRRVLTLAETLPAAPEAVGELLRRALRGGQ